MGESTRVLHLDDDPGFADLAADMLERADPRFEVLTENDPSAALDRLRSERDSIDVVLSDYQMPGMDGIEFLRTVRERYPDERWPFILLTGHGNEEVAADAMNAGATSYVQKGGPDTFEYLAERVHHDLQMAAASKSSTWFDTLVSSLDDPVYVLDREGRFVYVNDAFVTLTGYDRETILGSEPSLVKTERAVEKGETNLGRILSDDGPESIAFEIEIETRDGDLVPCEDHMGVLPYEGDQFRGSLGTLRDISERKAREEAIAEAKERYQRIVEQNLVGLYLARDGDLIYHNDTFAELFGYDPASDALDGDPVATVVERPDRSRLRETLSSIEAGEIDSLREPYVGLTADGESIKIELFARGIELNGRPSVIGTIIDVGAEDETYQQLRQERDRLEEFTSVVSHDLRNPLQIASSRLELAAEETETEHIDHAMHAIERGQTLIDDLLMLARGGDDVGDLEPVALSSMATGCWQNVDTTDATLTVESERAIMADRNRLKQLIENLYRNAVEHGGPDVSVTVGELDDGFYVADDGPGIPADQRETVFEAGYSTSDEGTGFGLRIVEQVANAHGWDIDVTVADTGGARFEVTGVELVE